MHLERRPSTARAQSDRGSRWRIPVIGTSYPCLLFLLIALWTSGTAQANVFTLVQTSGADPSAPQPGDVFSFEIHYEQTTDLVSLGFSVRTTGRVLILSATPDSSSGCYLDSCVPGFCKQFCPLSLIAAPAYQFDVTPMRAGPWAYIATPAASTSVAAGTVDDAMGPLGGPVGAVAVQYFDSGTLEIFENAATDDETYAPLIMVIAPTPDSVLFNIIGTAVPMMSRWGWILLVLTLIAAALASYRGGLVGRRS